MAPQLHISLRCMPGIGNHAGSPGEMLPEHRMPVDDDSQDILFVFKKGAPSFEPMENENKNLKPDGTVGWFCTPSTSDCFINFEMHVLTL